MQKTSQYSNKKNLEIKTKKFTLNLKENLQKVLIRRFNKIFKSKKDS